MVTSQMHIASIVAMAHKMSCSVWGVCALKNSSSIKITFVRLSVHPSVTEGQRKRFDIEIQAAVYLAIEHQETRQPL